jgi:alpha-beta hydrolase superfamily lysophospholipase
VFARKGGGWEEIYRLDNGARVAAPVLLPHGSEDTVVPIAQSKAMADALPAAGRYRAAWRGSARAPVRHLRY